MYSVQSMQIVLKLLCLFQTDISFCTCQCVKYSTKLYFPPHLSGNKLGLYFFYLAFSHRVTNFKIGLVRYLDPRCIKNNLLNPKPITRKYGMIFCDIEFPGMPKIFETKKWTDKSFGRKDLCNGWHPQKIRWQVRNFQITDRHFFTCPLFQLKIDSY